MVTPTNQPFPPETNPTDHRVGRVQHIAAVLPSVLARYQLMEESNGDQPQETAEREMAKSARV